MRKRGKIWYRYKETHQWKAYTVERSKYNKLLYLTKWDYHKNDFTSNRCNSKHLYNLMAKLTGGISANSLPESTSDKDLSEKFADFFLLKILNTRENQDMYEKYEPNCERQLFSLENCKAISELDIRIILLTLKTKSCELDEIPTSIIKNNLDYFIKPLTHISSLSLQGGQFDSSWKCAIIKPLIKKQNGPLEKSNIQKQFNDHCNKALQIQTIRVLTMLYIVAKLHS